MSRTMPLLFVLSLRAWSAPMPELRVSHNHRYLETADGQPFFYLGDTAWELFHRLTLDEAESYLKDRAAKGFAVIQAVVLAEFGGLTIPNANGHLPLIDLDPTKPNEDYFRDVDAVVDLANSLGLYVGLLPTWGDKVNQRWGQGPVVFNPENARVYGEFLGRRYRDKGIVWINGGDRIPETDEQAKVFRQLAAGLQAGDGGRHLLTYHPMGGNSSSKYYHSDDWLDFDMMQSGHSHHDRPNYKMVRHDLALQPPKPTLDGEPCYEDHPVNWKPENGWFDDWDVRKTAYWGVFAGAAGTTYGCHDIWQFWTPSRKPVSSARTDWHEAIALPGSTQVGYLKRLMLSRPYLERAPDPSLLVNDHGDGPAHCEATRAADGSYAMVYTASGEPIELDLTKLSGTTLQVWWFDPRTGEAAKASPIKRSGKQTFTPPTTGEKCDWVLVLDDVAKGYRKPGTL